MNKEERRAYLIRKGEQLKQTQDDRHELIFAALPPGQTDVDEEVLPLESFIENTRDTKTGKDTLTSDEE